MEKGTELQGKYMILRLLGEGGEGKIYLAYDSQENRNVAVRVWEEKPTKGRLAAWKKMISLGKLPGIAQIYEVWEAEDVFYMALEYAEGQNGVEYLESRPQGMDAVQAVRMMAPVAEGLSILHEKGLLHRDISTDNLLIKGDGSILLCDPGLMCETMGDPDPVDRVKNGFSPLEMYIGDGRQGTWSDVYEYCASLSHLITGQVLPVPAMRKDTDPFAGRKIALPGRTLDLLRAGLEVAWEKRLRDVKPFCEAVAQENEGRGEAEARQEAQPIEVVRTDAEQLPYMAQPQMRTLPVNAQNVASLQPDNAMNAGRRQGRSEQGRFLWALGIVALLLVLVVGGFAFYQAKNGDDSETAEEDKNDKKDKKGKKDQDEDAEEGDSDGEDGDEAEEQTARVEGNGAISWDELMERYTEYLETQETRGFNSFKLVDIDDDELPECFMGWTHLGPSLMGTGTTIGNSYIGGLLYYNAKDDEIVYADAIHFGNFDFEDGILVKYAEKENVFYLQESYKEFDGKRNYFEKGTFFSFGEDGRLQRIGNVLVQSGTTFTIANNRRVEKSEYEEYISDFGELNEHFDYGDMYYSLDKAYEKYLQGK